MIRQRAVKRVLHRSMIWSATFSTKVKLKIHRREVRCSWSTRPQLATDDLAWNCCTMLSALHMTLERVYSNRLLAVTMKRLLDLSHATFASIQSALCWLSKEMVLLEHSTIASRRVINLLCLAMTVIAGWTRAKLETILVTDLTVTSLFSLALNVHRISSWMT